MPIYFEEEIPEMSNEVEALNDHIRELENEMEEYLYENSNLVDINAELMQENDLLVSKLNDMALVIKSALTSIEDAVSTINYSIKKYL